MAAISNGKGANTPCGVTRPLGQLKLFLGIKRFLMVWPRRFAVIFRSRESAKPSNSRSDGNRRKNDREEGQRQAPSRRTDAFSWVEDKNEDGAQVFHHKEFIGGSHPIGIKSITSDYDFKYSSNEHYKTYLKKRDAVSKILSSNVSSDGKVGIQSLCLDT